MEANRLEGFCEPERAPHINAATMGLPDAPIDQKSVTRTFTPFLPLYSEGKYPQEYYCVTGKAPLLTIRGLSDVCTFTYVIQVEYSSLQDETIATTSAAPKLLPDKEPELGLGRGVFCPKYHRKVLFSQPVTLKIADLPRWKPKVVFYKRTFEL